MNKPVFIVGEVSKNWKAGADWLEEKGETGGESSPPEQEQAHEGRTHLCSLQEKVHRRR